jgi:hypothetical protein
MNYNIDTDVFETEFEDLAGMYDIQDAETIHELIGTPVILNRYKDNFNWLVEHTVDVCKLCWGNKDKDGIPLQKTMIPFKVDINDKVVRGLPLNRFMLSMVFVKTVARYIDDINIDDFILHDAMTKKMREKIQDHITDTLGSYGIIMTDMVEIMARMALDLKHISLIFSRASMDIYTAENIFLDHYRECEEIRDINNTEYPSTMQSAEIIEENSKRCKRFIEIMSKRDNPFIRHNKYTKILKDKQIEELAVHFGQIPDGRNTVPVIMNGNGLKGGYHDPKVMYAGAIAARVPDMMNKDYMGSAGYFNRNLMILTYGTISKTVWDCGSKNLIPVEIDEVELDMKDGRYYSETKNGDRLKLLHKDDKHLIGKTLYFRSPCTCNLREDVCHICYGTKALKLGGLKGGFIYTTEAMSSRVQQNILSAKHLLRITAEVVKYSEGFDNWFVVENSEIMPDDEKKFNIYIPENYQDDISEQLTIYVGKGTKEMIPLTVSHYANIHIPDEVFEKSKEVVMDDENTYFKITSSKVLELDTPFCLVTPINIMMTQKYMDIMKLFESDISKYENISEAVSKLTHLIYGIMPILSTHGEIIIGQLIRDANNKLLRPNWLEEDVPYQMLRLKTALANTESITTALSFEQPKHHLLHSIFDERNKINRVGVRSFSDFLYGEEYL